ncbi:hypothetical protein CLOP_g16230 [Closterium sp. NIES-67]|nr:hypothetical protein CLOP_g16230 [Closterium sp. NIES-67]
MGHAGACGGGASRGRGRGGRAHAEGRRGGRRGGERGGEASQWRSVLILVPLVLGIDHMDARYLESLRRTFAFPQSVGIAGGKPNTSLYFIGTHRSDVLFLDPHYPQQAVDFPEGPISACHVDTSSYHCNTIRHMPLSAIDSSLALGFYCATQADFDDLCDRMRQLAQLSNGAPLLTVGNKADLATYVVKEVPEMDTSSLGDSLEDTSDIEDNWELV